MIAIVDCNSFYCSCERLFKPQLENKPVVVLSNNDGCIVSRSDEAKTLGVGMACAYFEARHIIEQNDIAVFSSNYNLYGDLSWRVMETLRIMFGAENVEVYSVDEAFINLKNVHENDIYDVSFRIKQTVEQWTGIKVSVGVAATKVLAKLANRLAKKNKEKTQCIMIVDTHEKRIAALKQAGISSVWGVGFSYAEKLKKMQIHTAYDLSIQSMDWCSKNLGGVVGMRLMMELKGIPCLTMKDELTEKKMITTTRMFGKSVSDMESIKQAVATYTSRAAEKLRRQNSAAKAISVFLVTKQQSHHTEFKRGATITSHTTLPVATSLTHQLIKPAIAMAEKLFVEGTVYKKAGVMLSDIVPDSSIQASLFANETNNVQRLLMDTIDNINFSQRDDILKYAASGTKRNWKMQQKFHSPRYTSRWTDLCLVH